MSCANRYNQQAQILQRATGCAADATQMAQNVAAFIQHNQIDLTNYSMDQVVAGYFRAEQRALKQVAQDVEEMLEQRILEQQGNN